LFVPYLALKATGSVDLSVLQVLAALVMSCCEFDFCCLRQPAKEWYACRNVCLPSVVRIWRHICVANRTGDGAAAIETAGMHRTAVPTKRRMSLRIGFTSWEKATIGNWPYLPNLGAATADDKPRTP
jgi:hypothetical protein